MVRVKKNGSVSVLKESFSLFVEIPEGKAELLPKMPKKLNLDNLESLEVGEQVMEEVSRGESNRVCL